MITTRRQRHSPDQNVWKLRDTYVMLNMGEDEAALLEVMEEFERLSAGRRLIAT